MEAIGSTIELLNERKLGHELLMLYLSALSDRTQETRFSRMYDRHSGLLEKAAARAFPEDDQGAKDALQETWMYVASRMHRLQFDNESKERIYLLTVLRYRIRREWHKLARQRRTEISLPEPDELLLPEAATPEGALCGKESERRVKALILSLSATDRDILTLVLLVGLSVKEAAKALNVKEGAAQVRYTRAKQRLVEKIREEGILNV